MKEDKELIEEIIERLKAKADIPYNDGAWERFKETERLLVSASVKRTWPRVAAVAASLLVTFFAGYVLYKNSIKDIVSTDHENKVFSLIEAERKTNLPINKDIVNEVDKSDLITLGQASEVSLVSKVQVQPIKTVLPELPHVDLELEPLRLLGVTLDKAKLERKDSPLIINDFSLHTDIKEPEHFFGELALANSTLTNVSVEKNLVPRSFRYGDRFSLGVFVSPNTTSDNLKVGAGFTVAYNINKKISIRTGASYNTYEVGILKDPLSPANVETVNAPISYNGDNTAFANLPAGQTSKMSLPNVNAVSGFVESVEIPLEIKYNLSKSFYAAAGVSYSTIVNQERNAQYIENIDMATFQNGFPTNEKEASQAMKVVTKTVKSSEKNVSTNGYNGFVNLSVGKKVNVTSKFGVSIEPYFKISVGEFRQSDMNYNNGGIRIMTTF